MAIRDLRRTQVVVTGAASGIGRATAIAFAREGANIVAADLDEAALARLKSEIEALGVSCVVQRLDVSDEAAVGRFAETVQQFVGAPDVLVNNAGIGFLGLFLRSDLAHWKRVLDVNLMGVVHGCYHFLPRMVAAGGPRHVLNVSSSAGDLSGAHDGGLCGIQGRGERLYGSAEDGARRHGRALYHGVPGCDQHAHRPPREQRGPQCHGGADQEPAGVLPSRWVFAGCGRPRHGEGGARRHRRAADRAAARLVYHLRRISLRLTRFAMVRFARQSGYLT